jgi:hypothetical protein
MAPVACRSGLAYSVNNIFADASKARPQGTKRQWRHTGGDELSISYGALIACGSGFRDPKQSMKRRIEAAKCAAHYVHPRLSSTTRQKSHAGAVSKNVGLASRFLMRRKVDIAGHDLSPG